MDEFSSEIISHAEAKARGLKYYLTGKPCQNNHTSGRYVSTRGCVQCHQEWRVTWVAANRARHNAHSRRYREANREKHNESIQRYLDANPDKRRETRRKYRRDNLEQYAVYARNRRAMQCNAPGKHTPQDIQFLYLIQNNCCAACSKSFDKVKAHVDHIVALSRGGSNDASNIQLLCAHCNLSKHDRDWEEWLLEQMLIGGRHRMTKVTRFEADGATYPSRAAAHAVLCKLEEL